MYLIRYREYSDKGYTEEAKLCDTLLESLEVGLEMHKDIRQLGAAFDDQSFEVFECRALDWGEFLHVKVDKNKP